jgi:alpha-1,3-rhamnosyl/mannosyltransferase
LYAGARCFLFTSLYEGFGLPPLEAMACGVPVVGSDASCLPEVVGDAGMLVDPMDARRMAGALIAVCTEDALHDRLSQRAALRAAQFTWQRTAFETLAVLKRVVASTSTSTSTSTTTSTSTST